MEFNSTGTQARVFGTEAGGSGCEELAADDGR
ncbi:hypothetical protein A2U01_0010720, partial [Trifolium medium]|nr:hypothetical protein [Trifolium medium]